MVLRIGVDVGGTNTDAVVMGEDSVLSFAKSPTSSDITSGVISAVEQALQNGKIDRTQIGAVMIGTTHFVNAIIEQKHLIKVAAIRICGPATRSIPPFETFPASLRSKIEGATYFVDGGFEFTGIDEISKFDMEQVKMACVDIAAKKIQSVVIVGVFSALNSLHEEEASKFVKDYFSELKYPCFVTTSHKIGRLGLVERENAAILNGTLRPLSKVTIRAFENALVELQLGGDTCSLFITQNDGTIMDSSAVEEYPILTFSSGPTNSMRGAAFLSGLSEAVVVDIGGTTTDVGVIVKGFPRVATGQVEVGGVPTNFQIPNVYSAGLGGGSKIHVINGTFKQIGPDSVAHKLTTEAIIFGGETLTTTDIMVASGSASDIGSKEFLTKASIVSQELIHDVKSAFQKIVQKCIDYVKTESSSVPVLLVGGGSIVLNEFTEKDFEGVSKLIKPPHFSVANAVGAAIAQASGTADKVYNFDITPREVAIEEATKYAKLQAVQAGAIESTLEIHVLEAIPITYLPGKSTRVVVKVVGKMNLDLELRKVKSLEKHESDMSSMAYESAAEILRKLANEEVSAFDNGAANPVVDAPIVVDGDWIVDKSSFDNIAIGCGILGTGGGGSVFFNKVRGSKSLRENGKMRIINIEKLADDDIVIGIGFIGAPTVLTEKIPGGFESVNAVSTIETISGKASAILCMEIGGSNGLEPLLVGSHLGLPVIDADLMGRAFPELPMITTTIYGLDSLPIAFHDDKGNGIILTKTPSSSWIEKLLRTCVVAVGCIAAVALSYTGKQVKDFAIRRSYSLAWQIGNLVSTARARKEDPVTALGTIPGARILFQGKIVDLSRETTLGFAQGKVTIVGEPDSQYSREKIDILFKNEFTAVLQNGKYLAVMPDLISIVDTQTGGAVATEDMKFGLRVSVFTMKGSSLLYTEQALKVVGPACFNLSVDAPTPPAIDGAVFSIPSFAGK